MLGDHIRALKNGRWVHGIDLGDQRVLFLADQPGLPPGDRLRRVYRPDFTAGASQVELVVHRERTYPAKAAVARAWSRFMDPSVVAMFQDSEQFAAWCKIGRLPAVAPPAQPAPRRAAAAKPVPAPAAPRATAVTPAAAPSPAPAKVPARRAAAKAAPAAAPPPKSPVKFKPGKELATKGKPSRKVAAKAKPAPMKKATAKARPTMRPVAKAAKAAKKKVSAKAAARKPTRKPAKKRGRR